MDRRRRYSIYILTAFVLTLLTLHGLASTPTIDTSRTETVFVYGTLENPIVRMIMCRCRVDAQPATVDGFTQQGLNILPADDTTVRGSVIRVSPTELDALDRYENVPDKYIRTRITDTTGAEHWVYILRE